MSELMKLNTYPSIHRIHKELAKREHAVFLDSSLRNADRGCFSILACRPYLTVEEKDSICFVDGRPIKETFAQYMKEYLNIHREEQSSDLPLTSGAVGYFSYDYGRVKEGVTSRHKKELDIPDCMLKFYDCFIIEDHRTCTLTIAANGKTGPEESVINAILKLLEQISESETASGTDFPALLSSKDSDDSAYMRDTKSDLSPGNTNSPAVLADFSQEDYMKAVDHMIHYIIEGDIYVVNMTHQLQIKEACPPFALFSRLRDRNPSPFGAYLDYGDFQIVCASPERFMKMKDGIITTRPIKGTRRRGHTPEEDQALKEELAHSEKDQSELLMIVDLERNDLNRVCVPGTVQVTELFKVETYATVFHLESNVVGQLLPENNAMDLIQAAFPGGSITGAPKLRAMELIDQEERSRRNLYTGSIGYLSLNGDCDLNIVIRTAVYKDGVYHLGVGGGITCESELEFEYEETWQKAKALLDAMGAKPLKGDIYEHTVR
ncbi:MAG: aminodeoxychorismate synthase component I [Lachnospiraceae bacterium]|nr:aminodeoxychorismate synthase component I [Lachnospiraceae bacterium]